MASQGWPPYMAWNFINMALNFVSIIFWRRVKGKNFLFFSLWYLWPLWFSIYSPMLCSMALWESFSLEIKRARCHSWNNFLLYFSMARHLGERIIGVKRYVQQKKTHGTFKITIVFKMWMSFFCLHLVHVYFCISGGAAKKANEYAGCSLHFRHSNYIL